MITQQQAEHLVYERINAPNPQWPDMPEMILTETSEHDVGWVIWWTSRLWRETDDVRYAIAGNAPYFVSRADGSLHTTGTVPLIEERIREIVAELRATNATPNATDVA